MNSCQPGSISAACPPRSDATVFRYGAFAGHGGEQVRIELSSDQRGRLRQERTGSTHLKH